MRKLITTLGATLGVAALAATSSLFGSAAFAGIVATALD
jgi:hypothetical protein